MASLAITSLIVALRNEKGSYNFAIGVVNGSLIVALRNEKGSYNENLIKEAKNLIVALRNEKGAIRIKKHYLNR